MLPHLTPGHTHPPPTISPLPLNRCCSIAVWSSECLPAQALCQSHPPQWPSLVLQMGLISDSQRQNAQRSSPQHSILRLLSGDTSPSLRSAPGNTHGIDNVFKTNSLHRQHRRSRMAKAQCGQNWIHLPRTYFRQPSLLLFIYFVFFTDRYLWIFFQDKVRWHYFLPDHTTRSVEMRLLLWVQTITLCKSEIPGMF